MVLRVIFADPPFCAHSVFSFCKRPQIATLPSNFGTSSRYFRGSWTRFGPVSLDGLPEGEYRTLDPSEVASIWALIAPRKGAADSID